MPDQSCFIAGARSDFSISISEPKNEHQQQIHLLPDFCLIKHQAVTTVSSYKTFPGGVES
jgi:hypothetical protein